MGRTKKKDSSVVFIGEEEDKTPLLQQDAWGLSKSKNTFTSKGLGKNGKINQSATKKKSFLYGDKPFPRSFIQYLFSESSVLIRMFSSLCPPCLLYTSDAA